MQETSIGEKHAVGSQAESTKQDRPTLKSAIQESEERFRATGSYWGITELTLKESDPIGYERIFSKLRGGIVTARESAVSISASPIVRQLQEICFALYTPEADAVAVSTGIMVHVHTASDAIKWMIRNDYEADPGIRSGDIFCNNEVYIGNVHNADVQTMVPIFWEEELIGWVAGIIHVTDIGGAVPGGSPTGCINRFEHGFNIPAQKIGESDRIYRHWKVLCEREVRNPVYWMLDEKARLSGCLMIRDMVLKVIREEGLERYQRFTREVIEDGRRTFLQKVKAMLVPGRYRAAAFFDVPLRGEPGIAVKGNQNFLMHTPMEMVVSPEGRIEVNLEGTSAWGWHCFNGSPTALQGAMWVLLSQTILPNDKLNDGPYWSMGIQIPHGSWADPDRITPATSNAWLFLIPTFCSFIRSLGRAFYARGFLEEIMAGYPLTMNGMQSGGIDHYGREFGINNMELSSCGSGARATLDGIDHAYAMWNPESDMGDVEVWERSEPLLYLGRRVKPNTAGAGKYRGGSGFESLRMVWKTNELELQNRGDGLVHANAGLFGGYPGATGYVLHVHRTNMDELIRTQAPYPTGDGDPEFSEVRKAVKGEVYFTPKGFATSRPFEPGDLYLNYLRGGPGYGDPLERDTTLIEQDVNGNIASPRFAESVYGAVLRKEGAKWVVDARRTRQRRGEIREERKARGVPARQWIAQRRDQLLSDKTGGVVKRTYRECMNLSPSWAREFREFWSLPQDFSFPSGGRNDAD